MKVPLFEGGGRRELRHFVLNPQNGLGQGGLSSVPAGLEKLSLYFDVFLLFAFLFVCLIRARPWSALYNQLSTVFISRGAEENLVDPDPKIGG